jgi:hypothetical protein
MKQIKSLLTLAFVFASAFLFVLTLVRGVPTATAAPPAPHAPQMSSANYVLDWSAAGEISGGNSASTHFKLSGTIGQMAANSSSTSINFGLCTGFQCVPNVLNVYLPLALKNF